MNKPYIFVSDQNTNYANATSTVVVLPDIFGITEYATATAELFANRLEQPVYMLDYFYGVTQKPTILDPTNEAQAAQAFELMEHYTGEEFLKFFNGCVDDIKKGNSELQSVTVIGFCFAGRLAYLTSAQSMVHNIVSFYGGGAHKPSFVEGKSAVEFLIAQHRSDIRVLSFYGVQDESIPEADRNQTQELLKQAKLNYSHKEYEAGHAYFQPGRPNYNEAAANSSWQDLEDFLKQWALSNTYI